MTSEIHTCEAKDAGTGKVVEMIITSAAMLARIRKTLIDLSLAAEPGVAVTTTALKSGRERSVGAENNNKLLLYFFMRDTNSILHHNFFSTRNRDCIS